MYVKFYIIQSYFILLYLQPAALSYTDMSRANFVKCIYDNNNNLSDNIENCVDDKLNDFKTDLNKKMDIMNYLELGVIQSVDKLRPLIVKIDQLPDKKDLDTTENNLYESIKKLNSRLDTMESNLQNSVNSKLQLLENNISREIKLLSDTMKTLFATNAKQLTDKLDLTSKENTVFESTERIDNRLTALGNITENKKHHITKNISNIISNITLESRTLPKVFPETNGTDLQNVGLHNLCDFKVPSTIKIIKNDLLTEPKQDDLDRLMIDKTGCKYKALEAYLGFRPLGAVPFNGKHIEFHVAVRTQDNTYMAVSRDSPPGPIQAFRVGYENNTVTYLAQFEPSNRLSEQSTPGILTHDRYVPFYIKIHEGTLSFGKICESEPMFTSNFTLPLGQNLQYFFGTVSEYGAKYLYDCPTGLADFFYLEMD